MPAATALIMNKGVTADPTMPAEPEFEQITEHSAYTPPRRLRIGTCCSARRATGIIWGCPIAAGRTIGCAAWRMRSGRLNHGCRERRCPRP
jgi:hypothetical protein